MSPPPFFRACRDTIKTSHNHLIPSCVRGKPSISRSRSQSCAWTRCRSVSIQAKDQVGEKVFNSIPSDQTGLIRRDQSPSRTLISAGLFYLTSKKIAHTSLKLLVLTRADLKSWLPLGHNRPYGLRQGLIQGPKLSICRSRSFPV